MDNKGEQKMNRLTFEEIIIIDCILRYEIEDRKKNKEVPTFGGVPLEPIYKKWEEIKYKAARGGRENDIQR